MGADEVIYFGELIFGVVVCVVVVVLFG